MRCNPCKPYNQNIPHLFSLGMIFVKLQLQMFIELYLTILIFCGTCIRKCSIFGTILNIFFGFCLVFLSDPEHFVMGRLDVSALRYLSKDDLRTLQAVEQGMKNHDIVPVELISSIAALKHGGAYKCLSNLLRNKLIKHDRKRYDGYSLNNLGYDYLAFNTLSKRGVLRAVGRQIGVGKESDVFIALDDTEERQVCSFQST